jgi:predicted Zn-dependent peptidase
MIVAAAGSFKSAELVGRLEAAFKDWSNKETKFDIPKATHKAQPGIYCFHKEGRNINQGRVTIAHLGIDIHNPDVHAIRVMNYIYGGGGFSSRLVQKVRSEEGLAYSVHSDFSPGIDYAGTMRIQFQSKSESCAYAAKLCLGELNKLRTDGVSEQELKHAQKFYLDAFPGFFFKTKFQTVTTFASAELNGLPKNYYQTYREKIASLTIADIARVAKEYLHPEKFVIVVVGDIPTIKNGDKNAKLTDLGKPVDIPLPDPLTLERSKN